MSKTLIIEINFHKIKITETIKSGKNYKAFSSCDIKLEEGMIDSDHIVSFDHVSERLQGILATHNMKTKNVIFIVDIPSINARKIDIVTKATHKSQLNLIKAYAKKNDTFLLDVDKASISYSLLNKYNNTVSVTVRGKKKNVKAKYGSFMCYAIPMTFIEDMINLAKICKLNIVSIEYIGHTSYRATKKIADETDYMSFNILDDKTIIDIVENGVLVNQRIVNFGTMSVCSPIIYDDLIDANDIPSALKYIKDKHIFEEEEEEETDIKEDKDIDEKKEYDPLKDIPEDDIVKVSISKRDMQILMPGNDLISLSKGKNKSIYESKFKYNKKRTNTSDLVSLNITPTDKDIERIRDNIADKILEFLDNAKATLAQYRTTGKQVKKIYITYENPDFPDIRDSVEYNLNIESQVLNTKEPLLLYGLDKLISFPDPESEQRLIKKIIIYTCSSLIIMSFFTMGGLILKKQSELLVEKGKEVELQNLIAGTKSVETEEEEEYDYNDYEEEKEAYNSIIRLDEETKTTLNDLSDILKKIEKASPSGRIKISTFNADNTKITMTIIADSKNTIVGFMEKLEKSGYFSSVNTNSVSESKDSGDFFTSGRSVSATIECDFMNISNGIEEEETTPAAAQETQTPTQVDQEISQIKY